MSDPADNKRVARRSMMICPYGHTKQIARYCHTCKRLAARQRYKDDDVLDKIRAQRRAKKISKTAAIISLNERKSMSILTNAPSNDCAHALAYEVADNNVICYGCGAEWPKATGEVSAEPTATKSKKAKKTKAEVGSKEPELQDPPGTVSMFDSDVQPSGDDDEESEPELQVPLPDAPTIAGSVPKARRRGKKAEAAPETIDSPEYSEAGPWDEIVNCPSKGCFSKLKHHAPNIITNGRTTYHYGCPTCGDVRVTVHLGEIS